MEHEKDAWGKVSPLSRLQLPAQMGMYRPTSSKSRQPEQPLPPSLSHRYQCVWDHADLWDDGLDSGIPYNQSATLIGRPTLETTTSTIISPLMREIATLRLFLSPRSKQG